MALQRCRELTSVFIVMTLLLSSMAVMFTCVSSSDASAQISSSGSDTVGTMNDNSGSLTVVNEDCSLFTYDAEKGVYVMTDEGLEAFGLSADPSEEELIANGLIAGQMEIATQYSPYLVSYNGYKDDGSEWDTPDTRNFFVSDAYRGNLYVGFSAGMTRLSTDSVSNISYHQDWDCRLCYGVEEIGGVLPMYLLYQPTHYYSASEQSTVVPSVLNITDLVRENIPGGVSLNEFTQKVFDDNGIKTFNSQCVLNHAEGDFDGDGNEEIAIAYCNVLVVLKLVNDGDGGMKFTLMNDISDFTEGWYRSSGMTTPAIVSMASGDVDGDLRDELLIASQTKIGSLNATRLSVYDIHGDDDGQTEGKLENTYSEIIKLKDSGRTYYTCATSVVTGDVDCDGRQEIVLGGYVANWNDSNVHDASYREGELFLTYVEYSYNTATGECKVSDCLCTTFPCEEDGTAFNIARCRNIDTSACEEIQDNDLNAYGRLSVSYVDATIPLQTVSLYKNSFGYYDSVFFYTGLYSLDDYSSSFLCNSPMILKDGVTEHSADDRCILNIMDIKACRASSNDQYPYEELVITTRCYYYEYTESHMHYSCDIYSPSSDDTIEVETPLEFDMGRISYRWLLPDNTEYEYCYIGNFDDDATIGMKVGQLYMYTDPSVVSMISGLPVEDDLANMYISQQSSIGEVSVNKSNGTSQTEETETGFTVDFYGGIDGLVKFQAHEGVKNGHLSGTENTFEIEYAVTASTDAVTLYVVPVDVYVYLVTYRDDDGNVKQEIQAVPVFSSPKFVTVSYEDYERIINEYNSVMGKLLQNEEYADEYYTVSLIELDHTPGDVSTYPSAASKEGYTYSTDFKYLGAGSTKSKGTYTEVTLKGKSQSYSGSMRETFFNFDVGMNVGEELLKVHFEFEAGTYKNTTTTTGTIQGGGFSIRYIDTVPVDLKSNAPEENSKYYTLSGLCYTTTASYAVDVYDKGSGTHTTKTVEYTYVGFGIKSYDRPSSMGTVKILSEDDDKEFAVYPDSFCFDVYVPSNSRDTVNQQTMYYEVQIYISNVWNTINAKYLSDHLLTMKQWDGDGWVDPVLQLQPGASDYHVTYLLEGFSITGVEFASIRVLATYEKQGSITGSKVITQLCYLSEDIRLNNAEKVALYMEKEDMEKEGKGPSASSSLRWAPGNMFEKEGYVQNGWKADGNIYAPGDSLAGVRKLSANWVAA